MSLSVQLTSPHRPSLTGRLPRLPVEEATRIIRIARRKSSDGASIKDRNLRVFLGHAHIAETLKHEFVGVEEPSSHDIKPYNPSSPPQHIQWVDTFAKPSVSSEDDSLTFEDDGEEDFCSLALVRTSSRSTQPPRATV